MYGMGNDIALGFHSSIWTLVWLMRVRLAWEFCDWVGVVDGRIQFGAGSSDFVDGGLFLAFVLVPVTLYVTLTGIDTNTTAGQCPTLKMPWIVFCIVT
jgi:hypothetical protein